MCGQIILSFVLFYRPNAVGGVNRRLSGGRGPPGSADWGRERIFNAARYVLSMYW